MGESLVKFVKLILSVSVSVSVCVSTSLPRIETLLVPLHRLPHCCHAHGAESCICPTSSNRTPLRLSHPARLPRGEDHASSSNHQHSSFSCLFFFVLDIVLIVLFPLFICGSFSPSRQSIAYIAHDPSSDPRRDRTKPAST